MAIPSKNNSLAWKVIFRSLAGIKPTYNYMSGWCAGECDFY